jgi:hypothetical protein
LIEASHDNKIKKLDVWMIGALSSHPDLLADIANGRKYKTKPARLKITLRLLSLSSCKKNDIAKILQGVKTFTCEGTDFEVEITKSDYLFPEGYGAALEALRHIPEDAKGFDVLDLGGGTITYSLCEWVMDYPIVESLLNNVSQSLLNGRYVFATGGGFAISAIAEWIEKYVCTGIDNPKFFILDNPQSINLTGLSRLNISA